MSSRYDLAAAG